MGDKSKKFNVNEQAVFEWLQSIHLEEYIVNFLDKGYDDLEFIKVITKMV